jgi:hypothetical protein
MSAVVRGAVESDLFGVYRLLRDSTLNSRNLPLDARRRMFEHVWGGREPTYGYVMEDEGKIVGFLGTLYTERVVNGRPHKFCEIHSWYVEESYRNQSLSLLLPALSMKNITILNYTPTQTVYDISCKFGFQDLEKNLLLIYPVPTGFSKIDILSDKSVVADHLDGENARIFNDHRDVECHHLCVMRRDRPQDRPLYLIVKSMRRRWFEPFGRVLYVSDRAAFTDLLGTLRWKLCLRFGWQCLVANEMDVDVDRLPAMTKRMPREVPSQIKSKTLKPEDIHPLYTLPLLLGYRLH